MQEAMLKKGVASFDSPYTDKNCHDREDHKKYRDSNLPEAADPIRRFKGRWVILRKKVFTHSNDPIAHPTNAPHADAAKFTTSLLTHALPENNSAGLPSGQNFRSVMRPSSPQKYCA